MEITLFATIFAPVIDVVAEMDVPAVIVVPALTVVPAPTLVVEESELPLTTPVAVTFVVPNVFVEELNVRFELNVVVPIPLWKGI